MRQDRQTGDIVSDSEEGEGKTRTGRKLTHWFVFLVLLEYPRAVFVVCGVRMSMSGRGSCGPCGEAENGLVESKEENRNTAKPAVGYHVFFHHFLLVASKLPR